jgi:hypothetical protein
LSNVVQPGEQIRWKSAVQPPEADVPYRDNEIPVRQRTGGVFFERAPEITSLEAPAFLNASTQKKWILDDDGRTRS